MTRTICRLMLLGLFAVVAVGCGDGNKVEKPGSFVASPGGMPVGAPTEKGGKPTGPTAPQVTP